MSDADFLSKIALFSPLRKKDLRRIAKLASHQYFKKGDVIIREGDRDGRVFVVISGEVAVIKDIGKETEKLLAVFKSENYFGEMAILDDYVRAASVVAREDSDVISLDQWNLREEILKNPSIAIELLQTLSRRLRKAQEQSY
jgi:CRP-like cAMP-binding protein